MSLMVDLQPISTQSCYKIYCKLHLILKIYCNVSIYNTEH